MARRAWLVAVVAVMATAGPAFGQSPFRWRFAPNQRFYLETTTVIKQTHTVQGQAQTQELTQYFLCQLNVQRYTQEDRSVQLEQKIEAVKVTGTGPQVVNLNKALEPMVGATFRITLAERNGQYYVARFEGYEELIKRVGGDDPNQNKMFRATMPEEALRRGVEEGLAFGPDQGNPARWQRTYTMPMGALGNLATVANYAYEGRSNRDGRPLDKIGVTVTMTYQSPKGDTGGLAFHVARGDLKADQCKGTLWFDSTLGRLVESEMEMHLKGALTVVANGQEYPMEMEQHQVVRTRVLDQPPANR
jgi:hypothetical protein